MQLVLKSVYVAGAGAYPSDHMPDNLEFFDLSLAVTIEPQDQGGGSLYQLNVCTPDCLKQSFKNKSTKDAAWGRHLLIIDHFDVKKLNTSYKVNYEKYPITPQVMILMSYQKKSLVMPIGSSKTMFPMRKRIDRRNNSIAGWFLLPVTNIVRVSLI